MTSLIGVGLAMILMTVIELYALSKGINGQLMRVIIACIFILAGGFLGWNLSSLLGIIGNALTTAAGN